MKTAFPVFAFVVILFVASTNGAMQHGSLQSSQSSRTFRKREIGQYSQNFEPPTWPREKRDIGQDSGFQNFEGFTMNYRPRGKRALRQNDGKAPVWPRGKRELRQNDGKAPVWPRGKRELRQNDGKAPVWPRGKRYIGQDSGSQNFEDFTMNYGPRGKRALRQNDGKSPVWPRGKRQLRQNGGKTSI